MRILVVDSDPHERGGLRAELSREGHEVVEAEDGYEALVALRGGSRFDAVIAELSMRRMDGYRLAWAMRRDPDLRDLPFIVCTSARPFAGDADLAFRAGADRLVRKPAGIEDLRSALRDLTPPAGPRGEGGGETGGGPARNSGAREERRTEPLRTNERLEELVHLAPIGIVETIRDGTIVSANETFARMLGYRSPDDLLWLRMPRDVYWEGADRPAVLGKIEAGEHATDVRYRRLDGGMVWIEANGRTVRDADGNVIGYEIFTVDVTARRESAERLRQSARRIQALSHRFLAAQELERRRVAAELHDEIGQGLATLKLALDTLAMSAPDSAGREPIEECSRIAGGILRQARDLSLTLRPSVLDDLGLLPALRWMIARVPPESGVAVELVAGAGEGDRYPGDVEIVCFRVAQAALTNALHHAAARRVRVALLSSPEAVELTVADDGAGFDVDAAHRRARSGGSLGLLAMEERASLVGGVLRIESAPGRGTRVALRVPVAPAPGGEKP